MKLRTFRTAVGSRGSNQQMKTPLHPKATVSLGDLISAVSGYSTNSREMLAALTDLFRKGVVVAKTRRGAKRLRLAVS